MVFIRCCVAFHSIANNLNVATAATQDIEHEECIKEKALQFYRAWLVSLLKRVPK